MSRWRMLLTMLFLAGHSVALADHCAVTYRPTYTYSAPSYSYSAPYVAPTYQPSYDRVLLVPKVVTVYDQPSYYYSLGDSYRDALLADAIAFRVLQAQAGRAPAPAYIPRIPDQSPGGNPGAAGYTPSPAAAPRLPPMPPAVGEIQTAVPAKLQATVTASCVKCHNGPGQNGLDLSNLATVPPHARDRCCAKVVTKQMPKGGSLKEDEIDPFYEWRELGETAEKQARR